MEKTKIDEITNSVNYILANMSSKGIAESALDSLKLYNRSGTRLAEVGTSEDLKEKLKSIIKTIDEDINSNRANTINGYSMLYSVVINIKGLKNDYDIETDEKKKTEYLITMNTSIDTVNKILESIDTLNEELEILKDSRLFAEFLLELNKEE